MDKCNDSFYTRDANLKEGHSFDFKFDIPTIRQRDEKK